MRLYQKYDEHHLYENFASYLGRERINGTVRVLFKMRLIFSHINSPNVDVDRTLSRFYNKFNKMLNKHTPFKTLSKRRIKQLSKPWITNGIHTAIKIKNNLYMRGNDAQYKYYRNEISKLT